jgi:adenylosuccinate synthase
MAVVAVIGMQWGDEGKGKVVDILAKDFDYIVRFNGGENAGHTVVLDSKEFKLHLLPSGVLYSEKFNVIGNGVVINPETLLKEINDFESAGVSMKNLLISERAHLVLPWHKIIDGIDDEKNEIGTTKKGIGPAYGDKVTRTAALRIVDLLHPEKLRTKIERIIEIKRKIIGSYGKEVTFDVDELYNKLLIFAEKIKPFITDTTSVLNRAIKNKKNILLEGAQGTLLDIDHGTYPYVTSSNTVAGSASVGSGIPPTKIDKVIGITKAYTTRVGGGPFQTELKDEIGEKIRQKGGEFGTTTGRPRRCGWLDLVALRYAKMLNDVREIIITKLDVFDGFREIKVCTAYEIDGKEIKDFPVELGDDIKPVYKTFKGWRISKEEWREAAKKKKLPEQCSEYVDFIRKELDVKIRMVSFGPDRRDTIIFF